MLGLTVPGLDEDGEPVEIGQALPGVSMVEPLAHRR